MPPLGIPMCPMDGSNGEAQHRLLTKSEYSLEPVYSK